MRRALVIGAQTFGLKGVEPDVEEMTDVLCRRDFEVCRCVGPDATRDGIIAAYRRLIEATDTGDVALVYYAGHGGYVEPGPGEITQTGDNTRQFIVPTDFERSGIGDFRGITAVELSVLLAELTEKTDNAVVILDCCHSAVMSRGDLGEARVRQINAVQADLDEHHRQVIAKGRVDLVRREGNLNAVRLVACGQGQFAHEVPRGDGTGRYNGVLTLALVEALREAAGRQVTWSRLLDRVRHRMRLRVQHQRPAVEGPFGRLLFETGTQDAVRWLYATDAGGGRASLAGALLLGVEAGDEFDIMPASGTGDRIATLRIDRVDPLAASGPLVFDDELGSLPVDTRAYRVRAVAERIAVRVPTALAEAVGRAGFVRVAGANEDAPIEVVELANGALAVRDRVGLLHPPRPPGPEATERILTNLDRVGRAMALCGIRDEPRGNFDPPVELEWGLVQQGRAHPLPERGAVLRPGDLVYLLIRNNGPSPVRVSLVDVGVSYAITVMSDLDVTGIEVTAGSEYLYGADDFGDGLLGMELVWPESITREAPRPETILVFITSEPHDVSPLQQEGMRGERTTRDLTGLGPLLDHFGAGATRGFRKPVRYRLRTIEFTNDPTL